VKGVLAGVVHEPLSFVNAPVIARERGIAVSETRSTVSRDYVNLVALRAETEAGEVTVAGTMVGKRNAERLVQVFDFDIDMAPARHMLFFLYEDRPGVVGRVGTILGESDVNIAAMEVGRRSQGGMAVMGLTLDGPVPPTALERIVAEIRAERAHSIVLPG
jgi:D-3-phosphoglycerate dehydrogenase